MWAGDNILWEMRGPGANSETAERLEQVSAGGVEFGIVGYTHAGGVDRPLVACKTAGGGSPAVVVPHMGWRGQFSMGTAPSGANSPVAVEWPGFRTTAYHSMGETQESTKNWMGSLLEEKRDVGGLIVLKDRCRMTRAHSWSTGALAASLVLWISGCAFNGTGQPSGDATLGNMRMIGTAIEAFRTAEAHLPEDLDAICTSFRACEHYVLARTVDEWGIPLRYFHAGSDYTLQSSGADRRFDTSDDFVLSTAHERERVQVLGGCYAVSFPWWEEFTGDKLMLRTEPQGPSSYELLPKVYGATGAWRPIAGDSVEMTWARGVGIIRMVLQRLPDSSLHGWWRAGGEYRSSRTRQVTAVRVNC